MKNKILAGFLALFFGMLGVHRFYLGRRFQGILYVILFFITLTATIDEHVPFVIAPVVLGLIDAILLFAMPWEDFNERYNAKYLRKRARQREEWMAYYEEDEEEEPEVLSRQKQSKKRRKGKNGELESFLRKLGIDKFRSGDFLGAIETFREGLEESANSPMLNYNIACCFSMLHDAPSGFEHLEKAVANGFDDLEKIHKHAALHYLRSQPEFDAFVQNGYRRRPATPPVPPNPPKATTETPQVIDELFQLGELMQKGLISEDEFQREKQKLLRD